jgi:hypothetical protein
VRREFFPYAPPGHLMVMVFFMLSGYVIGLTNKENKPFELLIYLKKKDGVFLPHLFDSNAYYHFTF